MPNKQDVPSSSPSGIPVISSEIGKNKKKKNNTKTKPVKTKRLLKEKKKNAAPSQIPNRKIKFHDNGRAMTMTANGEPFPDLKNLKPCGGALVVNEDNVLVTVKGSIVNGNNCQVNADACVINGDGCLVNGDFCIAKGNRGYMWGNQATINGDGWTIRGAVRVMNSDDFVLDGGSIFTHNCQGNSSISFCFGSGSIRGRSSSSVSVSGNGNVTAIGGGSVITNRW